MVDVTPDANQRGFTVIELLCAFAVFSVLAVALVHTGHGHTQATKRAFHETLALRFAQSEIETVRAQPTGLGSDIGERSFELTTDASTLPAGRGLRTVREIEPRLFEVTVEVSWLESGAEREGTVRLVTRIAVEENDR